MRTVELRSASPGSRPCRSEPTSHPTDATLRSSPATTMETPRCSTRARGANDSALKNAAARIPRMTTVVGRPRASRNAPPGSNRRAPQTRATRPTVTMTAEAARGRDGLTSPVMTAVSPTAVMIAWRLRSLGPVSPVPPSNFPRTPRSNTSGRSNTTGTSQKTVRQVVISVSHPAMSGPIRLGTTQAAERSEKARGRRRSSKARAMKTNIATIIAPPPSPWMPRAEMSTHIEGAKPAAIAPTAKIAIPLSSGMRGPILSDQVPATTMPTSDATT